MQSIIKRGAPGFLKSLSLRKCMRVCVYAPEASGMT